MINPLRPVFTVVVPPVGPGSPGTPKARSNALASAARSPHPVRGLFGR